MKPRQLTLIERFVDGSIVQSELEELRAGLQADEPWRKALAEALYMRGNLDSVFHEDTDCRQLCAVVDAAIGGGDPGSFDSRVLDAVMGSSVAKPVRKKRHIRRVLVMTFPIWAAALLTLVFVIKNAFKPGPPRVATVASAAPGIQINRDGAAISLSAGDIVHDGDVVHVPDNGRLSVQYRDGTRIDVAAGSRLQFNGERSKRLFVASGSVRASVTPQKQHPFVVASPIATAKVIGTRFNFASQKGKTELRVDQGEVQFSGHEGAPVSVTAGQTAVAMSDGAAVVMDPVVQQAAVVAPASRQLAWQRIGFAGLLQFGLGTTDARNAAAFEPSAVDARLWAETCKAAGMGMLILDAKPSDGFCLWPSRHTRNSVANSPWRGGAGDLVREVSEACDQVGLKFGISFSHDDPARDVLEPDAYNTYIHRLLKELLTNYGPLAQVRLPGNDLRTTDGVDFERSYKLIRQLQPDAVISARGPDVRWFGGQLEPRKSEWSVIPQPAADWPDLLQPQLGSRAQLTPRQTLVWYPCEFEAGLRPGRGLHIAQLGPPQRARELENLYNATVGSNQGMLLRLVPSETGQLTAADKAELRELGERLRIAYTHDLARNAVVTASKVRAPAAVYAPANVVDRDPNTFWTTEDWTPTASLEIRLPQQRKLNRVVLAEAIHQGQRVESFEIDFWRGDSWQVGATGTTIGANKICRLPTITTDRLRLRILRARFAPTLARFSVHLAALEPPVLVRNGRGKVKIIANAAHTVHFTTDRSEPTRESARYRTRIDFRDGGILKARAFSGTSASPVAQAEFGMLANNWRVSSVSSEKTDKEDSFLAIDGDLSTHWHTNWGATTPSHPHHLAIDFNRSIRMQGFRYHPRGDGLINGTISEFSFETSMDGRDWQVVADGIFDLESAGYSTIRFAEPVTARYIKLTAKSEINGRPWASVGELELLKPQD